VALDQCSASRRAFMQAVHGFKVSSVELLPMPEVRRDETSREHTISHEPHELRFFLYSLPAHAYPFTSKLPTDFFSPCLN